VIFSLAARNLALSRKLKAREWDAERRKSLYGGAEVVMERTRKSMELRKSIMETLRNEGDTNELDAETAVSYVTRWLAQHPSLRHLAPPVGVPLPAVVDAFRAAAAEAPSDADVHTVLGVLYNLSRDYDAAIDAFSAALALTPGDYSLWNKLGATQANSARSGEALTAYRRALDLKPNYVRAWCNMGIGYANQGAYAESAAYYVRALSLNPAADGVWGYLRISLSCIGRDDLMPALDAHDLAPLLREFPL
jgi:peroxin-5